MTLQAPSPADFIPIFGMITGTIMTIALGLFALKLIGGPVGQAIARRIQGRHGDVDLQHEVGDLREQVGYLEQRLQETEERLEFAERLLARQHDLDRLPDASSGELPH